METAFLILKLLAPVLIAFAGGFFCGSYRRRTRMPKHSHAWDKWENVGSQANPIQARTCIGCGEHEVKTHPHTHAWGQWKDIEITTGGKNPHSGQRRWCSTCNKTEIRGAFDVD